MTPRLITTSGRKTELHHLHGDVTLRRTVRDRSSAGCVASRSSRIRSPPGGGDKGQDEALMRGRCGDRTPPRASFAGGTEAWVLRQMAEPD
jgi:hypothetical protein